MAGILDAKTRIFDTLVTPIGREQMSMGGLQIKFVSFSDASVCYTPDIVSGSADISDRVYFEASPLPFDRITFGSDESGFLHAPGIDPTLSVIGGRILSGSGLPITGSALLGAFDQITSSSLDNIQKLRLISSIDPITDDGGFHVYPQEFSFRITQKKPLVDTKIPVIDLKSAESIFQDKRLSHHVNFMHMPPINEDGTLLGNYPLLGQGELLTFDSIRNDLSNSEHFTVMFSETSRDNNLIAQLFDVRTGAVTKLDIIDFGEFPPDDRSSVHRQVFFAGRIFRDEMGVDTYINLFTLVFE